MPCMVDRLNKDTTFDVTKASISSLYSSGEGLKVSFAFKLKNIKFGLHDEGAMKNNNS